MKKVFYLFPLVLFVIISCSKSTDDSSADQISQSSWLGTYNNTETKQDYSQLYILKNNGNAIISSVSKSGNYGRMFEGTWERKGDSIKVSHNLNSDGSTKGVLRGIIYDNNSVISGKYYQEYTQGSPWELGLITVKKQ